MATDGVSGVAAKIGASVDGLTAKVKADGEQQAKAYTDASGRMRDASGKFLSMGGEVEGASRKATGSVTGLAGAIGGLGPHFLQTAASVAGGMAAYAGFSGILGTLVGAVRSTIGAGIDFGDMMNTLQAVTGATAAQMGQLQRKAIDLGNDLTLPNTSAADAARAMTELAKAGLSVDDTMAAAKGTLQLAAAAGVDEAQAAQLAATALNAFHLQGKEAGRVADLLAASANASAADIGEMGLAMQQSSASAAQLHIPIQDLVTMIAEMANAGIKGSDAGTSVKTMLAALTPNSAAAAVAMKQLGVSAFDVHGNLRPIPEIINQYSTALAKLNPQQRQMAIETIFGSDASRAAAIILGQSSATFVALEKNVTKVGAAQDVASAKSKGLGGALRALQSEAETMSLQIYQRMEPALEGAAKWAGEALPKAFEQAGRWVNQLLPPIQALVGDFADLVGKAGDSHVSLKQIGDTVVGVIVPALRFLHDNFGLVEAALAALTFRWVALNVAMAATKAIGIATFLAELVVQSYVAASAEGGLTAAQWLLNIAMDANPVGAVILGLTALVAIVVLAATHWREITELLHRFWLKVQDVAGTISRFIEQHRALAVVIGIVGGPVAVLVGGISLLISHWNQVVAKGGDVVGILRNLWDALRSGEDPVRVVAGALGALLYTFGTGFDQVRAFESAFVKLGDTVVDVGGKIAAPVKTALVGTPGPSAPAKGPTSVGVPGGPMIEAGAAPSPAASEGLLQHAGDLFSGIGSKANEASRAAGGFFSALGSRASQIVPAVGGFFSALGSIVETAWSNFASRPAYWVGFVLTWVPIKLYQLQGAITDWFAGVVAAALRWAFDMVGRAEDMAARFLLAVGREFNALPGQVAGWLGSVLPQVWAWAGNLAGAAWQAAVSFNDAVNRELSRLPGQVWDIGRSVAMGIYNGFMSLSGWVIQQVNNFAGGLLAGAKAALGISSPSTVMAALVGVPIAQGIAAGIQQGAPIAHAAMAGLIDQMPRQAFGLAGGASATGGGGAPADARPVELHTHVYIGGEELATIVQRIGDARLGHLLTST